MTTTAPSTATAARIRSRLVSLRAIYAASLIDTRIELERAEQSGDTFARGMYQGRAAAFKLILADLDKLQEVCRHA